MSVRCLRIWRFCLFSFPMLNGKNRLYFLTGILERVCTNLPSVANPSGEELLAEHSVLVQTSPLSPKQQSISFSLALQHLPVPRGICRGLEVGFTPGKGKQHFKKTLIRFQFWYTFTKTSYTLKMYINVYWQIFSSHCCSFVQLKSKYILNPYK